VQVVSGFITTYFFRGGRMSSKHKNHAIQNSSVASSRAIASNAPSADSVRKEIEIRAHQIYCERAKANRPGDAHSDWHQAEREINDKYKK
jgi:hypothetical protein